MQVGLRALTLFVDHGAGARFTDVDGNSYLDMNVVDLAGFLGFAPEPVNRAMTERAAKGGSFLLPTEDGIAATEMLAARTSERGGRLIDKEASASMERKKREGYF